MSINSFCFQTFGINRYVYLLGLTLLFGFWACQNEKNEKGNAERIESVANDLELDHVTIWVNDPAKTKAVLTDLGFTVVPDSISEVHEGQGTAGRYFNFLNTYLELIFVNDQNELNENCEKNKDLDFSERANFEKNEASPFGVALTVTEHNPEKIPFETVNYRQDWMQENTYIYAAKNSKLHFKEPSVFVVPPEIESIHFESASDLDTIPDEYAFWRDTFKHPNGAQKITKVVITSSELDGNSETMKALNGIKSIRVKKGKEHLMELYFDDQIQGKSFDLRPDLPLIVYL